MAGPDDWASPLTQDDFDIPRSRRCFTPSELAHYLMTDTRTITRLIEEGLLQALSLGYGRYKIPQRAIAEYFLRMQGGSN